MSQKGHIQNPWAGLSSYEDPARSSRKLKFCGRDSDTFDVTRLIDDNFFVTLYGKSGIGKTSLLNAGVFPALRREQYTPLSLRLGMTEEAQPFQEIITANIERVVVEAGGSVRVVPVVEEQLDRSAFDYLWNWFARRQFLTAEGQTTFPVVVFDQFEEVFRQSGSRTKTEVLLAQLHYLIDESHAISDCIVEGEEYTYDFNFRFVISIREDDLYRLEDSLDSGALTALKRCRYRLRSLSEQGARAAILLPGEGLFRLEEQDGIVQTIIGMVKSENDGSISTNLLSLLCSRIYIAYQHKGEKYISLSLLDDFISGNPFEQFYKEATNKLTKKSKNKLESSLITVDGHRRYIEENEFKSIIPNEIMREDLIEGDSKILQRICISSQRDVWGVELLHDTFCEVIKEQKRKRYERKTLIQRFFVNGIFDCIVLSVDVLLFLIFFVTQGDFSSMLLTLSTIPLLIFSTYMINVTRIHNDIRMSYFLLLQIATSFIFWAYLLHHDVYAFYGLKPHTINVLIRIFFFLNVILFGIGLLDSFLNKQKSQKLTWKDFFSIHVKENRYAQFSILFSVFFSMMVLLYYGNTGSYYVNLRNKVEKDTMDLIELGNYYMTYDTDIENATKYYRQAADLGSIIAVHKLSDINDYEIDLTSLTDQMRMEVLSYYLNQKFKNVADTACLQRQLNTINSILSLDHIDTAILNKQCINEIIAYYDKIKHSDSVVMRWKSVRAFLYDEWGNLGYQFWQGEYVDQDKERAFEIYLKHKSHNNVVTCYVYGWGVKRDINKALEYAKENNCYLPLSTRVYLKFGQIMSNNN